MEIIGRTWTKQEVQRVLIFIMIVTMIHPALNKTMNQTKAEVDLFQNGSIYTVDENRSWAEVQLKNGIITLLEIILELRIL